MAFTEPVYPNKGGLFGAQTGRKYEASEVEKKGGDQWSKPSATPSPIGAIVMEVEDWENTDA
jgi:hypothetical protein